MSTVLRHPAVLLGFALLASLAIRWPYFLYQELGWDEILYSMIALDALDGVPPYTGQWDRKPIGIFLIMAGFHSVFGDGVLALRLAAATAIGLSAAALAVLARLWLPAMPWVGVTAAGLSIIYTLNPGGAETNTEIWFAACIAWAAVCLTKALRSDGWAEAAYLALAFLLFGIGVQIKYVVVFSGIAFAVAYFVARTADRGISRSLGEIPAVAGLMAAGVTAAVLPSALLIASYTAMGHLDAWWGANITANFGLVSGEGDYRRSAGFDRRYVDFFLPLMVLAPIGAALFFWDSVTRRLAGPAMLMAAYLGGGIISLLFLARFTPHMAMEVVPAISLVSAYAIHRGAGLGATLLRRAGLPGPLAARLGAAAAVLAILLSVLYCVRYEWSRTAVMLAERSERADPHWGDLTAAAAAHLRERLELGETIYVFGRTLGLYPLTGRTPLTDYAFHLMLTDSFAPIDGPAELARILATCPNYIIQGVEMGPALGGANGPATLAMLADTLEADYVVDRVFDRFEDRSGRRIGEGNGLTIHRRGAEHCPAMER